VQAVLRIGPLPGAALDAAAAFHAVYLPQVRQALAGADSLVIVFGTSAGEHSDWRKLAVADLAREAAPGRVNGVTGTGDDGAIEATVAWLEGAGGITGQLFTVEATNAGNPPE